MDNTEPFCPSQSMHLPACFFFIIYKNIKINNRGGFLESCILIWKCWNFESFYFFYVIWIKIVTTITIFVIKALKKWLRRYNFKKNIDFDKCANKHNFDWHIEYRRKLDIFPPLFPSNISYDYRDVCVCVSEEAIRPHRKYTAILFPIVSVYSWHKYRSVLCFKQNVIYRYW